MHALPPLRRWLNPGVLIFLLMTSAITVVFFARTAPRTDTVATTEAVQSRSLRFIDQPDGAVAAIDNDSGQLVQRFEGEQGFLRGTLRAMVRERRLRGVGAGLPFELILHHDGRLTLRDPSTGTRIALESFGATNTRVFSGLLH